MRRTPLLACFALVFVAQVAHADQYTRARHHRIRTHHGAIHVWTPRGYDVANAGIVLYIHGYFTDVDHAWRDHHLARQFADSGINALFIACEAPAAPGDDVSWTSATALLAQVETSLDEPMPSGPVVAVGHSGAHRTLSAWVSEGDSIDTIGLLDALYGEKPEIREWIEGSEERRLIDVGEDTRQWTDELHASLPETMVFPRFPPRREGHLDGARTARIVYVRSQLGHMPLVTGGVALPMVLRASRIASLPDTSRKAPIRGL